MTALEHTAEETSPAEEEAALTTADYQAPRAGTWTNVACGATIALVGLGALLVAIDLGLGTLAQPQAGTWPGLLSGLLILLGVLIIIRAKTFDDAERITTNATAVAVGAVSLAAAVQLMPHIGFEIPAVLLMIFWMSILGKEKYRLSVPISAVSVAVFYLIFVIGLNVPIPRLF